MSSSGQDSGILARFADTFFGVLTAPRATFKLIAREAETDRSRLAEALALVTLIASLDGLRQVWRTDSASLVSLTMLLSAASGIALWLSVVAAPTVASMTLGRGFGRAEAFAVTTAWSFLPWLFMPALSLWEPLAGTAVVVTAGVLLFAAMVRLFWIAVQETFELSSEQILYFVFVIPQLVVFAVWMWASQLLGSALSLFAT